MQPISFCDIWLVGVFERSSEDGPDPGVCLDFCLFFSFFFSAREAPRTDTLKTNFTWSVVHLRHTQSKWLPVRFDSGYIPCIRTSCSRGFVHAITLFIFISSTFSSPAAGRGVGRWWMGMRWDPRRAQSDAMGPTQGRAKRADFSPVD